MNEDWGQPVIVETRPGGATMIGTAGRRDQADPDGYTLLITVSNHATNPALQSEDAVRRAQGLRADQRCSARAPVVIYTHPSFPPSDVKELVALGQGRNPARSISARPAPAA